MKKILFQAFICFIAFLIMLSGCRTFKPLGAPRRKPELTISPEVTISNVINNYETQILENIQKKKFRKAIIASAEYEQKLISMYNPPIFHMNQLQSEATHISFHSPFTDWKEVKLNEHEMIEGLHMMGFYPLLSLEGKVENEALFIFSANLGRLEKRLGFKISGEKEMDDQSLLLFANSFASDFGEIQSHTFQTIKKYRVLILDVIASIGGFPITQIDLYHSGHLYLFLLMSSSRNQKKNKNRLFELISTINFNYKIADEAIIERIREKFTNKDDLESILQCIDQLAVIGEYNAAGEEFARLRILLSQHMSKPFIEGNIAQNPAYGLTLVNPDDKKWKLRLIDLGAMKGILLEDRWSLKEEGMMISIMDLVLLHGPQAAKIFEEEEMQKEMLISSGRAGALSIGTSIENEQLKFVKGNLAYEAIVSTNTPSEKAKCVLMMRPGFMLMILMRVGANTLQEKIAEYDKIIQGDCLQIVD